jgi:glycosyltransferase involved in cell wall biosynthesis
MSNFMPLVSVMVTSFNQRDDLLRAVNSVLGQTYGNIQIVIADDFSTKDDSRSIISDLELKHNGKIKAVLQPSNLGISKNKVAGFRACDGVYLTYLDGDDYYFPEKIEKEVAALISNPGANVVYSNFAFANEDGSVRRLWNRFNSTMPEGNIFAEVYSRAFPNNTVFRCELIEKKLFERINYFDESLSAFEDWDARIRFTQDAVVAYSNYVGMAYVSNPVSLSRSESKRKTVNEALLTVVEKNKHLLANLPLGERKKVAAKLENFLSRRSLISSFEWNKMVSHFTNFPLDILDVKLSMNIVRRIMKRKISRNEN